MENIARRLEGKFPHLTDDVTNSLLLFEEMKSYGFSRSDASSHSVTNKYWKG
jgi:hypothetical protein